MERQPSQDRYPTIDGRLGGVRESLENQTINLAKRVAELISSNVRYPNGDPVDCVIANSCIGGIAEATACEDQFRRENVGVSLTVTPCWCYRSETMDMDPQRPRAVFGFNGTERPGAVYLAAVLAGHSQKGIPAFGHTVKLPDNVHDTLDKRTNPTWPTTWFAPTVTGRGAFTSTYEVMNHWGANHCVMTAGHVGHLFITLVSIHRIPFYMHNVDESKVFRPSAWNAFGTDNLEGADFRACQNFGPLYRRH